MAKPRYRIRSDGTHLREVVPADVGRRGPTSYYMRGERSPFFAGWFPALRDERDEVRAGYTRAAARAIDMLHNSGWLAGGIEQSCASLIGIGLRLAAKPDGAKLGWDKSQTDAFARKTEREFESWANCPTECDAGGRWTLSQLTKTVVKSFFSHGEAFALLPRVVRDGATTQTKIKLMSPHKLVQDSNGVDTFQGVRMDKWGMPISYLVLIRHLQEFEEKVSLPARDLNGCPQVAHVFEGTEEQIRGITPIAPTLERLRQFDQLSDATLQQALIQALWAATVESEAPTTEVLQALQDDDEQGVAGGTIADYLGSKADFYQNTKFDFGRAGRVAHMFPGEQLKFNQSKTPNENYEAFAKLLLREIARGINITYETLTGDYSAATYSSVRMSISELWPLTLSRRQNIPGRFNQTAYEAWFEEAVALKTIELPGGVEQFYQQRAALTRAEWRGPPKPQADDLKTQRAHQGYMGMQAMTLEQICAELGSDWEDTLEQLARERDARKKLNLPEGDAFQAAEDDRLGDKLAQQDDQGGGSNAGIDDDLVRELTALSETVYSRSEFRRELGSLLKRRREAAHGG